MCNLSNVETKRAQNTKIYRSEQDPWTMNVCTNSYTLSNVIRYYSWYKVTLVSRRKWYSLTLDVCVWLYVQFYIYVCESRSSANHIIVNCKSSLSKEGSSKKTCGQRKSMIRLLGTHVVLFVFILCCALFSFTATAVLPLTVPRH